MMTRVESLRSRLNLDNYNVFALSDFQSLTSYAAANARREEGASCEPVWLQDRPDLALHFASLLGNA